MQFRIIVVTDPQTNKQTHKQTHKDTHKQTGPITIHCAAKLSAQCNNYLTHCWTIRTVGSRPKLYFLKDKVLF